MSTNEDFGTHDPEKDPSLMFHWVLCSIVMAGSAGAGAYTHYHLNKMYSDGLRLEMIGHPTETTAYLVGLWLWPVISLLTNSTKANIDCILYMTWGQVCGAMALSMMVWRTLRFTFLLALSERTTFFIRHGPTAANEHTLSLIERENLEHSEKVLKKLNPRCRKIFCTLLFIIFGGPLIFLDPQNISWLMGDTVICFARTNSYCLIGWYVYALWFIYTLRKFELLDPFDIVGKIKVQALTLTFSFILFVIALYLYESIGSAHFGLWLCEIMSMNTICFWYTEAYVPLRDTKLRIETAKAEGGTELRLALHETLANPDLLQRFEQHCAEEWATENLEFYKQVVLFEVACVSAKKHVEQCDADEREEAYEECISSLSRKACKIYVKFIISGAGQQVNLPSRVVTSLDRFFGMHDMLKYRETGKDSKRTSKRYSSFLALTPLRTRFDNKSSEVQTNSGGASPVQIDIKTSNRASTESRSDFDRKSLQSSPTSSLVPGFPNLNSGRSLASPGSPSVPGSPGIPSRLTSPGKLSRGSPGSGRRSQGSRKSTGGLLAQREFSTRQSISHLDATRLGFGVRRTSNTISTIGAMTPCSQERKRLMEARVKYKKNQEFCKAVQATAQELLSKAKRSIGVNTSANDLGEQKRIRVLMTVFDEAKLNIYKLMSGDSHVRFSKRKEMIELVAGRGLRTTVIRGKSVPRLI